MSHCNDLHAHAVPLPDALRQEGGLSPILDRLDQLDDFTAQVSQAIESLVDGLLQVQQKESHQDTILKLQTKVLELEQKLNFERLQGDLAHVSRMHGKERRVVFVSGRLFSDNIKYTWMAMRVHAEREGIDLWYLPFDTEHEQKVRELGGQCFPALPQSWTPEHVTTALGAAVLVTHDHLLNPNPYVPAMLAGARHVQLWHGISIKEVGFRNLVGLQHFSPHMARVLRTCGWFSTFVGTSTAYEHEWRRWFGFERYAPLGYARNDVMYREPSELDLVNVDLETLKRMKRARSEGQPVFFYAPTFRDADQASWLIKVDLDLAARGIKAMGGLLVLNLHPVEQPYQAQLQKALPGVHFVQPGTDIYPLLRDTSALITDYSSLMFDYLHLDRPIFLFRPDHQAYVDQSRKLFDAKLADLPGPVLDSAAALVQTLRATFARKSVQPTPPDAYAPQRHALAQRMFDHLDGKAGERLAALLTHEVDQVVPSHVSAQAH